MHNTDRGLDCSLPILWQHVVIHLVEAWIQVKLIIASCLKCIVQDEYIKHCFLHFINATPFQDLAKLLKLTDKYGK